MIYTLAVNCRVYVDIEIADDPEDDCVSRVIVGDDTIPATLKEAMESGGGQLLDDDGPPGALHEDTLKRIAKAYDAVDTEWPAWQFGS